MKWRRQQNSPGDRMLEPELQHDLGAEGPSHQPWVGQRTFVDEPHCGVEIVAFVDTLAELTPGGSTGRAHTTEIETQHGEIGQCRQSGGRLADEM